MPVQTQHGAASSSVYDAAYRQYAALDASQVDSKLDALASGLDRQGDGAAPSALGNKQAPDASTLSGGLRQNTSLTDGTFTIGFCGTGSNAEDGFASQRYYNGEIVSTLLRHTAGQEFVDKLTVDGPGSGNRMASTSFSTFAKHHDGVAKLTGRGGEQHAMHAMQVVAGKSDRRFGDEGDGQATGFSAVAARIGNGLDTLLGVGTSARDLQEAREQVQSLEARIARDRTQPIRRINLLAWSRGSACAHHFAHMLNENIALRHIEVRLICIDPVAGPGNHMANVLTIPPNVKEAVYYSAIDERSFCFEGFHPRRMSIESTKTQFRRMSGNHAMLVGKATGLPSAPDVARAVAEHVRMSVADQLRSWGTSLRETIEGATTTVPMNDPRGLSAYKATIDEAKAAGIFTVLHTTGYTPGLHHAEAKVYVTATGYAGLSSAALHQSTTLNEINAESVQVLGEEEAAPWIGSVVAKVRRGIEHLVSRVVSWLPTSVSTWMGFSGA